MKIALINMPFGSLYRPSIGISLLQASLEKNGFVCDTYYLNLLFGSMVTTDLYNYFVEQKNTPEEIFPRDWIFSQSLYGKDNFADYEKYINQSNFFRSDAKRNEFYERLMTIRDHVEPFLERALADHHWEQYDIIGFTSVFEQNIASLSMAKRLKEKWANQFIIFGGANCEGEMGKALLESFPFIDAVCSGEGDLSFKHFVQQMAGYKDPSLCHSQGIILQSKYTDEPVMTGSENSPPVHDMDGLPYPNYDDYFTHFEKYGYCGTNPSPRILFESSRGCWWGAKSHCRFCGLNGANLNYRSKSADRALEELLYLRERYQKYTKQASAVDNIIDMKYFRDFLPKLRDMQLDLDMFYETKANLRKEQVQLFRDANFHHIQPGIESLITSVLKLMGKGISMMQNIQLLKWTKEYGVFPYWNFLYGFPSENEEEYQKVVDVIQALTHLDPPGICSPIRLDRFSPYFNKASEFGIVNIRPMFAYHLVYQEQSLETLMKLAYHFEFDYASSQNPASYTQGLIQEIDSWKKHHSQSEFFSVDLGKHLVLVDLRPVRVDNHMLVLTGAEKAVFQFCDNIHSYKAILEHLERNQVPHTKQEVTDMLNRFVQQKLMLTESETYLSLAVPLGNYSPKKQGLERLLEITRGFDSKDLVG
ncbi:RiPP maturation radical SAM C-methyltransferase [Brevibacillus porteri]|uniref:RiPP maturation radical SAM C-methyltransferase n=1 Tax=Brevibacillus porteri TaxID=2126350 RepID=UPI00370C0CEB